MNKEQARLTGRAGNIERRSKETKFQNLIISLRTLRPDSYRDIASFASR